MSKKKAEVKIENENKRLAPHEYWEWRCAISDMSTARKEKDLTEAQLIALRKDIEIASLKARLFELVQIETAKAKLENSTNAYNENKNKLEVVHQISLSGKMIDEVTFEIKELQE
jgi:hypothetical protein